jgi:hypothetical protein
MDPVSALVIVSRCGIRIAYVTKAVIRGFAEWETLVHGLIHSEQFE